MKWFIDRIYLLLAGLLFLGIVYRSIQLFHLENGVTNPGWSSLVILYLFAVEIGLVFFWFWSRWLFNRNFSTQWMFLQYGVIAIFGIVPAIVSLYPAFIKQ